MKKVNSKYKVFENWEVSHNPMQAYALIQRALQSVKDLQGFGGMDDLPEYFQVIEDALKISHMCINNLSMQLFELDQQPGIFDNKKEESNDEEVTA